VHYDETCNLAIFFGSCGFGSCGLGSSGIGCHQRKRSPMAHVDPEFLLRIGDSRREAFLVHAPKGFEVFSFEVADDEGHGDIVAGQAG
jgi:hypothetical protein